MTWSDVWSAKKHEFIIAGTVRAILSFVISAALGVLAHNLAPAHIGLGTACLISALTWLGFMLWLSLSKIDSWFVVADEMKRKNEERLQRDRIITGLVSQIRSRLTAIPVDGDENQWRNWYSTTAFVLRGFAGLRDIAFVRKATVLGKVLSLPLAHRSDAARGFLESLIIEIEALTTITRTAP